MAKEYVGHLEWNNGIKNLLVTAANDPGSLGSLPTALVDLYWPKHINAMASYGNYIIKFTKQKYNQNSYQQLLAKVDELKKTVFEYHLTPYGNADKGNVFNKVVSDIESCKPLFCDKEVPETTLPLFIQLATLHIAYLWEQQLYHQQIHGNQANPERYPQLLREAVRFYSTLGQLAVDNVLKYRRSLINEATRRGELIGQAGTVTRVEIEDMYDGAIGTYAARDPFDYSDAMAPNVVQGQEDEQGFLYAYTEYVMNHYKAIMQLNVLDVCDLWFFLNPGTKPTKAAYLDRVIYDGPFGWFPHQDYRPSVPTDSDPMCLEVWYTDWIHALRVTHYSGQTTGRMGQPEGSGSKLYQKHAFRNSRRLVGVEGIFGKFNRWAMRKLQWVFTDGKHGDRCGQIRQGKDTVRFQTEIDRHYISEVILYKGCSGLMFGYKLLPSSTY